jgi:CP family cyanate transporter-like MFS transporter
VHRSAVHADAHHQPPATDSAEPARRWLLIAGIALIALNLRPALARVGPLVADMRADTGLSNAALGFITTLPLLAFGCLSVLAVGVGRRIGMDRALGLAMLLLGVGIVLRGATPIAALFAGTALLGVGVERRGAPSRVTLGVLARSPLAWQVALFMGFQSLTFYVLVVWLPDLLQSRGVGEAAAGGLLALSQATGMVGSALVPVWAGASRDQRAIIWWLALLEAVGLVGLALAGVALAWLWVSLVGFVLGGTFGLALTLLVLRAGDAETTGRLSGMAQSVGYLLAATGPPVFGWLHDVSGGWRVPLGFLIAVLLAKLVAGLPAGRPGTVRA